MQKAILKHQNKFDYSKVDYFNSTTLYEDELSGTKDNRPSLLKALEMLREDDTLVVWKLDRLGRSVKSLIELVSELNSKNIHFRSLTDSIDTSTPSGRFFFHL